MKKILYHLIIASSLPILIQTVSAQTTILTDDFTVDQNVTQNPDYMLASRQTGTQAPSGYTLFNNPNQQLGNSTDVGQPGSNPNYLLLLNGGAYNNLGFSDAVLGGNNPLSISFDLYSGLSGSDWMSFQIGSVAGVTTGPNQTDFGFLVRPNMSGLQVFNGTTAVVDVGAGIVTDSLWTLTFTGAGGIGSPFDGSTEVTAYNGVNLIYQGTLSTAFDSTSDVFGFQSLGVVGGIDNLNVAAVPEPGTMALAGLGGLSLLLLRRERISFK